MQAPQCAGSRVFRANLGDTRLPEKLKGMNPDHALIFSSHAEFVAHHKGITLAEAEAELARRTPDELTWAEMNKMEVRRKAL